MYGKMRDDKINLRLPERMRDEVKAFAIARFEGNESLAIRMLIRFGLDNYRELYSVDKPQKSEASTDNGEPEDERAN